MMMIIIIVRFWINTQDYTYLPIHLTPNNFLKQIWLITSPMQHPTLAIITIY